MGILYVIGHQGKSEQGVKAYPPKGGEVSVFNDLFTVESSVSS